MSSPAAQAQSLLVTASIGVLGGAVGSWPIFVGRLTTEPHAQIALYDAPGEAPNPKWLLDFPYFQAIIRGAVDDYGGAYLKAKAVKDALLGMDPQVVDGDRWDGVTGLGDVNFMRYDDSSRPLFTMNFRVILEPATNALTKREPL